MKKKILLLGIFTLFLTLASLKMVSALHAGFIEQTPVTSSLNQPVGLVVGDINNDSLPDVISASSLNKTINWYKNNGNNTFSLMVDIATLMNSVSSISVADLNNDNYIDVVATSYEGNSVAWYKNNGNQTFTEQAMISSSANGAISVATADLNQDGFIDVISANQLENTILWYQNNGDNSFTEQTPISLAAGEVNKIVTVDFNGDGRTDIISSDTTNSRITVFQNNGDNTFSIIASVADAYGTTSILVADLNNDLYPDVISANNGDETLVWYENNNGLLLEPVVNIATVTSISNIVLGDMDDDGYIDITTISNEDNKVSLYSNNQDGSFIFDSDISATIAGPKDGFTADLNNDGSLDMIVTSYGNNGINYFANQENYDFMVTFVNYDGTILQSSNHGYGSDLSELSYPEDPLRDGYSFSGWESDVPNEMPSHDITITPEYIINQYTIEYHDYDGTLLLSEVLDFGADTSEIVPPTTLDREGFVFFDWDIVLPEKMPSSDVTMTAIYASNQYTITFLDDDGTLLQTGDYDYLSDITDISYPEEPSRIGYLFTGWDMELPAQMTFGDIVVTATYSPILHVVEYQDFDGSVLQSQEFIYLSDLTVVNQPMDPVREGFEFIGWNNPLPSLMGTSDIILVAVYQDIQAPVISGISSMYYNQSDAIDFVIPQAIVEDNLDTLLEPEVSYYFADGETPLYNLNGIIEEIILAHDIVIKYNAVDAAGNQAEEVTITINVRDNISPIVRGIENNQIVDRKSQVTITFSDGSAKLNGREFESGTTITISNTYRLVVTDDAGNNTVVNFEIQDFSTELVLILTGSLLMILISGIIFIRVRGIF